MPSRGRTSHPGTRAAHTRRTKRGSTPVRAAPIKRPSAAQKRAKVARQVRQGKRPLLWGAAAFAGLGAFEAILLGRWGTAFVLFGAAAGLGLTHVAWSAHKRHQAARPSRSSTAASAAWEQRQQAKATADQQRREALARARAAHQPQPSVSQDPPPATTAEDPWEHPLPRDDSPKAKQRRYDEMQAMLKRQRRRGQTEMVWPSQYEEFFDGQGKIKPRPTEADHGETLDEAAAR